MTGPERVEEPVDDLQVDGRSPRPSGRATRWPSTHVLGPACRRPGGSGRDLREGPDHRGGEEAERDDDGQHLDRSRIWMIRLETARVTPAANSDLDEHEQWAPTRWPSSGARPKITNRMASGTQEITVLSALTSMVSSGKHSRGNWVLASSALLASRELPAGARGTRRRSSSTGCPRRRRGRRAFPGCGNAFTREKTTTKMASVATGLSTAHRHPEGGLLVLGPEVPLGQGVHDLAVGPQRLDRLDEVDLVVVEMSSGGSLGMVEMSVTTSTSPNGRIHDCHRPTLPPWSQTPGLRHTRTCDPDQNTTVAAAGNRATAGSRSHRC